ncbi:MAG: superoxide dismutase family protein [Tissierella sp.]|uniref:superoxide dismutase family protein n=1 Tax=Tissierella sp. TaxID=41274 RepID=UPI003F9C8EAD
MYKRINRAHARMMGSKYAPHLCGNVYFYAVEEGTEVFVEIWGLPLYQPATDKNAPISPFGFHVHEVGLCQGKDSDSPFTSAKGHYNPDDQPHGNHAGDLPVLFSNNGYARMSFFTDKFRVKDIIDRSVIIHQNPDDFRTQPAGDSGTRIACGIIKAM